jgi:hypothetical protein
MTKYINELPNWPKFEWDQRGLAKQLAAVRHRQGRLIGRMQGLGFPLREEAVLKTLTEDVLKSSEIEGEILDKDQVRSSIARRLGLKAAGFPRAIFFHGLTVRDAHLPVCKSGNAFVLLSFHIGANRLPLVEEFCPLGDQMLGEIYRAGEEAQKRLLRRATAEPSSGFK